MTLARSAARCTVNARKADLYGMMVVDDEGGVSPARAACPLHSWFEGRCDGLQLSGAHTVLVNKIRSLFVGVLPVLALVQCKVLPVLAH